MEETLDIQLFVRNDSSPVTLTVVFLTERRSGH